MSVNIMEECQCHNSQQLAVVRRELVLKENEFKRERGSLTVRLEQLQAEYTDQVRLVSHLRTINDTLVKAMDSQPEGKDEGLLLELKSYLLQQGRMSMSQLSMSSANSPMLMAQLMKSREEIGRMVNELQVLRREVLLEREEKGSLKAQLDQQMRDCKCKELQEITYNYNTTNNYYELQNEKLKTEIKRMREAGHSDCEDELRAMEHELNSLSEENESLREEVRTLREQLYRHRKRPQRTDPEEQDDLSSLHLDDKDEFQPGQENARTFAALKSRVAASRFIGPDGKQNDQMGSQRSKLQFKSRHQLRSQYEDEEDEEDDGWSRKQSKGGKSSARGVERGLKAEVKQLLSVFQRRKEDESRQFCNFSIKGSINMISQQLANQFKGRQFSRRR